MMLTIEQLQLIDDYFSKSGLSSDEQKQFDELLSVSKEFKQEIEFKQSLQTSLFRGHVRTSVQKRIKKAKTAKLLKTVGFATLGTTLVLAGLAFFVMNFVVADKAESYLEPLKEFKSDNSTSLDLIAGEVFEYDSDETLVAESNNGTVIVIPKNAFVDKNGDEVDDVHVKLQEYLTPEDIMLAGLSTESDSLPLESGGMFNITAKNNSGEPLNLKEGKEILFEVPTADRKTGMQVFDGETDDKGNVNWLNPKELDNYLTTVDLNTLDFYPPNYLNKLNELGYGGKSKKFKDSLFYSFYCSESETQDVEKSNDGEEFNFDEVESEISLFDEVWEFSNGEKRTLNKGNHIVMLASYACGHCQERYRDLIELQKSGVDFGGLYLIGYGSEFDKQAFWNRAGGIVSPHVTISEYTEFGRLLEGSDFPEIFVHELDEVVKEWGLDDYSKTELFQFFKGRDRSVSNASDSPLVKKSPRDCGITPAQIKTIWSTKYQNTFVATREFEERLKVIYSTCNPHVLDIYIKNMNRPMSVADNKAYKITRDKRFRQFYNRGTGTVKIGDELLKSLNKYYQKKSKTLNEISQKSYENYLKEQNDLDEKASKKAGEDIKQNAKRKYENYWAEYGNNVEKENKDLGTNYRYKKGIGITSFSDGEKYSKYQFRIATLGAKNIDRFLYDALETRETQTFTEKSGKTTTLSFKDIKVSLPSDSFDLVRVYLTSPTLFSFIKAKGERGKYNYRINESMDYNLAVVCQKDDQVYFYGKELIKDSEVLTIQEIKPVESLSEALKPYVKRGINKDIAKDIDYQNFIKKDEARKRKRSSVKALRNEIEPVVFPCDDVERESDLVGVWMVVNQGESRDKLFYFADNHYFTMVRYPITSSLDSLEYREKKREIVYNGFTFWETDEQANWELKQDELHLIDLKDKAVVTIFDIDLNKNKMSLSSKGEQDTYELKLERIQMNTTE